MQCWKKILSVLGAAALVACAAGNDTAQLRIRAADVAPGALTARLEWEPSEAVLDALDHGIALDFVFDLRAYAPGRFGWNATLGRAQRHVELRYFPLSRRYQLTDLDRGETRSYAARALLIAALEDLRLGLPDNWAGSGARSYALSVDLDRDRLPGALRLPVLLRTDWRLFSGDYSWQAADAG
jgi:hypothetical protein